MTLKSGQESKGRVYEKEGTQFPEKKLEGIVSDSVFVKPVKVQPKA